MRAEKKKRSDHPMNIPETLYRLRTARGLSQAALAEALDVSRQAVS